MRWSSRQTGKGGQNVSPGEIEEVLVCHPAVADAAVVGKPDAEAGEVPKAFVVKKAGTAVSGEELMSFVAERVASFKQVRDVEFVDAIPKNPSGKILRRVLVEQERAKASTFRLPVMYISTVAVRDIRSSPKSWVAVTWTDDTYTPGAADALKLPYWSMIPGPSPTVSQDTFTPSAVRPAKSTGLAKRIALPPRPTVALRGLGITALSLRASFSPRTTTDA